MSKIPAGMHFIKNHAAELGELTRAAVTVEIHKNGMCTLSRFTFDNNKGDLVLCLWHLRRELDKLFDHGEFIFKSDEPPREVKNDPEA